MKNLNKTILAALSLTMFAAAASGCTSANAEDMETEIHEITGGWSEAADGTITPELQEIFDQAMEGLIGVGYTPVELLETQLVSGMNYKFLAEARTVYPGAEPRKVIVTIYKDLKGNIEITDIEDYEEKSASIANPFAEADTIAEAEQKAGFSFLVPEELEGYDTKTVTVTNFRMIQIVYNNGEESVMIRKMAGTDDISGDYNVYDTEEEITLNDMRITAKANSDGVHLVTWTDGEYAYSLRSDRGMTMEEAVSLISSIR